ncbi:MAG: BBP7 family outer membrane beta-barrel protein [Planctomycetia bacterium]|nr:BBP7 family outer membrane beta-barrel protein [Planctomycetia bacterium]
MKSLYATGLILFVSLGGTAASAHAQSVGEYGTPSLLPLPNVAPIPANAQTASYTANRPEVYGSSFISRSQEPAPPGADGGKALPADSNQSSMPSSCWDGCDPCNSCCGAKWFGSVGGLVMSRNRANPFWTTFETNNNVNQLLNTQHAEANWAGGGQVTVGRSWCCGTGLAFTYWQLAPMTGTASITDPNNLLSTPINLNTQFGPVFIGSTPAGFFFDNSHEHRITRDDRVVNFELNVLQAALVTNNWMQLTGLAGFRYFRFDERLSFGAVSSGHNFGDNGGADEAFLNFHTTNNLFGAQVGAIANFPLTERLGIFISPKAGIFGNQMINNAHLFSGDGQQGFNITSSQSDVSFLGEIDTGLNWAFTPNLRAYIGYRVIGVSNIALSDNQFLPFLADQHGFAQIKQNGGLILHGGFAGAAWTF